MMLLLFIFLIKSYVSWLNLVSKYKKFHFIWAVIGFNTKNQILFKIYKFLAESETNLQNFKTVRLRDNYNET